MVSKKLLLVGVIVAVVVIVAVFVGSLLLGAFGPPVDVFSRPTPPTSESPESLLPQFVVGNALFEVVTDQGSGWVDAIGTYDGGIEIEITLWSSSGNAASYLDGVAEFWRDSSGSTVSQQIGEVHWFTHNEGGLSIFGWRKGVWTFEIYAPDETMRNQVVEGLTF
ncbi:MAG: hypothetical protein V3U17_07550 [Thermoplasmata archaeon]